MTLPSAAELGAWARASIREALGEAPVAPPQGAAWDEVRATFVTLRAGEVLQGCIGTLTPTCTLRDDVARHAVSAALEDPRARPIAVADVATLSVEVSVLSALSSIPARTRAEAIAALRPREDGVLLRWRAARATFLPQVWESLTDREQFVSALLEKAGLAPDFWADDLELDRYTVIKLVDMPRSATR